MKCRPGTNFIVTNKMQNNDSDNCDELRDPEDRPVKNEQELREKMLGQNTRQLIPTSDPPSTIPDPIGDDSLRSK